MARNFRLAIDDKPCLVAPIMKVTMGLPRLDIRSLIANSILQMFLPDPNKAPGISFFPLY